MSSPQTFDALIETLRDTHDLEEQEMARDVYGYLGIEIDMSGEMVELSQTGLTNKILLYQYVFNV